MTDSTKQTESTKTCYTLAVYCSHRSSRSCTEKTEEIHHVPHSHEGEGCTPHQIVRDLRPCASCAPRPAPERKARKKKNKAARTGLTDAQRENARRERANQEYLAEARRLRGICRDEPEEPPPLVRRASSTTHLQELITQRRGG